MANFFNEFKENLDNFKSPLKQGLRNLKDDINDTLEDTANSSNGKDKKGCLSKILPIIVICLIIGFINNSCDDKEANTNENGSQITSNASVADKNAEKDIGIAELDTPEKEIYIEHLRCQIEYARNKNINVARFLKQEQAFADWLNNIDTREIYLSIDKKIGIDEFKRTEKLQDYVYYGELKDNKPNGYGVLFKKSELPYGSIIFGEEQFFDRYYMGEFKDGKFHGFGMLFDTDIESIYPLMSLSGLDEQSDLLYNYFLDWENPVEYFGMFSKGKKEGLGNYFYTFNVENLENNHDLENVKYSKIEIGEYKNDELNGFGKIYLGGLLSYEGEFKDNFKHGKGKTYYFNSTALEYDGEFKYDKRHGKGTSYSENGEVIYSGEWTNDDYK